MRAYNWMCLALLLGCGLSLANALFFKAKKGLKSSGYDGYAYNAGYGGYKGYTGYDSYDGYGGNYGGYGYGYPTQPSRNRNSRRTGRTYSDIANVLRPDPYLGLGAGRYLPRAPYSHLWG